jgi:hypothetical protein
MRRICTAAMHMLRSQHFWFAMVVLAEFAAGLVVLLVIDPLLPPDPVLWVLGDPVGWDPMAWTCIAVAAGTVVAGTWLCLRLVHADTEMDHEVRVEWTVLLLLLGPIGHVLYLVRMLVVSPRS